MTWLLRLVEVLIVAMCAVAGWSLAYGLALMAGRQEPIYAIVGGAAGVMLAVKVVGWMRGRP
jgi:hypothetical protein